jgi:hypothetical protein
LGPAKRLFGWGAVILVLYSVTMAFVMVLSLASVYENFKSLSATVKNKSASQEKISALASDSQRAASAASDPTVQVLEFIPWIGSDIHAARVLSFGLNETVQSISPLLEQREALNLDKAELPQTLQALSQSTNALEVAIEDFDDQLLKVDPETLHFGLGPKILKAKTVISDVRLAVSEGNPLLKTAALLLNQPGETKWFVATQNAAELRAAGGLLGSYAILKISGGKVTLEQFGADTKLLAKGRLKVDFASGVDNFWGADLGDWRDLNVSSHIPDDGQIIADAWKQKFHEELDGVLFFSQGTVAHLVGAVGQANVEGETLTQENTVNFLTKEIYAKYPNVKKKNAIVSKLMTELFQNLSSQQVDSTSLLKSLANPMNEDEIYLWSAHEETQDNIAQLGLSGEVSDLPGSDVVVSLNNAGGNKIDAYLETSYSYELGKCGLKTWEDLDGREATVAITLTNHAPKTGLPAYVNPRLDLRAGQKYFPGSNREVISVYAPLGATDEVIFIDGKEDGAIFTEYRGRPVYTFSVELLPGQTRTVEVSFIEPVTDVNRNDIQRKPKLRTQRTLGGTSSKISASSFCAVG